MNCFRSVRVLCALLLSVVASAQSELILGDAPELFVDQHFIESLDGTVLKLWSPREAEAVLQFDKPWEGRYSGYVTVIHDGDLYRAYYRGLPEAGKDGSDRETTCYAESADGIAWMKPELGIHEYDGSTANNIILMNNAPYSHNFSPFVDSRPGVADSERFKAVAGTKASGLAAWKSPDGIHWEKMGDTPIITEGAFDSQNVAFWSEAEEKYLCYFRVWSQGDFDGYRSIARTTSADFVNWTTPTEMTYGGTKREHLYTNQTQPYFRNPSIYVATAARFMPGRRVVDQATFEAIGGEAKYSGDCSDTVLMTSRGGTKYTRTFMEGFVRPGLGLSNWSSRTNYPALGIVPNGDEEMSFYIQRNYGQTTHHLQRLVLRTDGFVSVHAPYKGGTMTTRPLKLDGSRIVINYATSAAGSIRVAVLDENMIEIQEFTVFECNDILGDQIAREVKWKGDADLSQFKGQTIRLRFYMNDADLFSVRAVE